MADVIILGNGPAGISASLYTARAGIKTTVIAGRRVPGKGRAY
jgi:thioredoxin reductase (NADPH)